MESGKNLSQIKDKRKKKIAEKTEKKAGNQLLKKKYEQKVKKPSEYAEKEKKEYQIAQKLKTRYGVADATEADGEQPTQTVQTSKRSWKRNREGKREGVQNPDMGIPVQEQPITEAVSEELREHESQERILEKALEKEVKTLTSSDVKLSRHDAINTYTDVLATESRKKLKIQEKELRKVGETYLAELLKTYIENDRYMVGYDKNTKNLKAVLKTIERRLKHKESMDKEAVLCIRNLKKELDKRTNGSLQLTEEEEAKVLDYSKMQPTEKGKIDGGRRRNAFINKMWYWSDQKDTPLFSHEPVINDLKQRLVSNCYMVAGTAGLVHLNPELLKQCLRDNGDGTVTVRLYRVKEKKIEQQKPQADDEIEILDELETSQSKTKEKDKKAEAVDLEKDLEILEDLEMKQTEEKENNSKVEDSKVEDLKDGMEILEDLNTSVSETKEIKETEETEEKQKIEYEPVYIKVSKEIPRIAGTDALSAGALWMQMIEKAAAFLGKKNRFGEVTGYQSLWYGEGGSFLGKLLGIAPEEMEMNEHLFEKICKCREEGFVYNTGTSKKVGGKDGLNTAHAYTIMGGKEVNGNKYILLRNPYGTHSLEYNEDGSISRTGVPLTLSSDETFGQFYIKYEDFLNKFTSVTRTDLKELGQNNK